MSNFKNLLLQAEQNQFPQQLQALLDASIINECEKVNDVYYISFAFQVKNAKIYPYLYEDYYSFMTIERADILYCGGMCVDSEMKILKGIINPYYTKCTHNWSKTFLDELDSMPYVVGTPQIITKKSNTVLSDWFDEEGMRVFNVVTDDANAWVDFIKKRADYTGTFVYMFTGSSSFATPSLDNDFTFYGNISYEDNKTHILKCKHYYGETVSVSDVVTVEFIENKLKLNDIQKRIVTKIYCADTVSKSIDNNSKRIESGLDNVGTSIIRNGQANFNGLSQIATEYRMAHGSWC